MNKRTRSAGDASTLAESSSARELQEAFDQRRKRSDEIRTEVTAAILGADAETLLDELYNRWELDATHSSIDAFSRLACHNFGVEDDGDIDLNAPREFGLRQLDEVIERHEQEAIAVFHAIKQQDPAGERPELQLKATKVIEMVYYAKRLVLSAFQARLAVHQLHCADHVLAPDLDLRLGSWTLRFRWIDQTRSTPLQKLLLHLLDTAMEKRYRKHNGFVYEPIVVEGYETHAWRQVCDIKEFVYDSAKKEVHWDQWCNLTASANNAKSAVEHLTASNDYQFPFLHRDRAVFAFRNGVYLAREDRFHRFAPDAEPLSDTVVAARYFDADFDPFDDTDDWRDIPTPHLQRIMDYQQWAPDVCDWMYVALGRLLYNVNERDGWQVIPFLHGCAATGKSTIALKVAKLFYEHADVGVLSNNIEKQFGISAFHDKLLFCGPEIKGDLKIEQAEFQSIVSGESVQVAAKHKKAFTVEWTVPGILAGNEVPAFSDNAGSVQRRFLVFSFQKAVTNGDMKLGDKLAAELPFILLKCNRAYLDASARWGMRNVWTVLPAYFQATRNEMAQAVNSIEAFLASTEVVLDGALYCPFKEFRAAWKAFSITNGYPSNNKPTTLSLFTTPFEKFGLRVETGTREYRGIQKNNAQWVLGIDLVDGDEDGGGVYG